MVLKIYYGNMLFLGGEVVIPWFSLKYFDIYHACTSARPFLSYNQRCKLYNASATEHCARSSNSEINTTTFILVSANPLLTKYI